jgi:GT2 family glycosyltransferase
MNNQLPLVSVCFITYDRLPILQETVTAFLERCTYPRDRLQLILCDDGSPLQVQAAMQNLPFDKFLFAKKNEGLGKNTNKGIKAADGKYVLQLQDDWLLIGAGNFIEAAVEVMEEFPDIGMVRYRELHQDSPFSERQSNSGRPVWVLRDDLELLSQSQEFASYTDNPHLKRKEFHERLGFYLEDVPMTKMEIDFVWRVARQNEIKVAYIPEMNVFQHIGAEYSYNPGVKRTKLREILLNNPITKLPFKVFLAIKHSILPHLIMTLKNESSDRTK